ncbi:MAG: hypothetical protein AAB267_08455, partial [Candidatus Desantisbacteria bacterium]
MGKGHIEVLRTKVTLYDRITAVASLLGKLNNLLDDKVLSQIQAKQEKGTRLEKQWIEQAIKVAQAKLKYLTAVQEKYSIKERKLLEVQYELAKAKQELNFTGDKEDARNIINAKIVYMRSLLAYYDELLRDNTAVKKETIRKCRQLEDAFIKYADLENEGRLKSVKSLEEIVVAPLGRSIVANLAQLSQQASAIAGAYEPNVSQAPGDKGIGRALRRAAAELQYLREATSRMLDDVDKMIEGILTPEQRAKTEAKLRELRRRPDLALSDRRATILQLTDAERERGWTLEIQG